MELAVVNKAFRKPSKCHPSLPDEAFGMCARCYGKAWYRKNKERSKQHKKAWRQNNQEKIKRIYKNAGYKKKYGITLQEFYNSGEAQKWACAICGGVYLHKLVQDHDHETNMLRSLLCNKCNLGLGQFRDDISLLERAIVYLRIHREKIQGASNAQ